LIGGIHSTFTFLQLKSPQKKLDQIELFRERKDSCGKELELIILSFWFFHHQIEAIQGHTSD
jgi:hypothetical protein